MAKQEFFKQFTLACSKELIGSRQELFIKKHEIF